MMKRLFAWILLAALLLTGCSGTDGVTTPEALGENDYLVYFTNGEETMLIPTVYHAEQTSVNGLIRELTRAMNTVPANGAYKKVRPEEMNLFIRSLLTRSGTLILYYDETYYTLKGTTEVLYRAAVTKTLCQIEGVEAIEVYVNEEPLMDETGNPVGAMSADNFLDNTFGELSFSQTMVISLFFATQSGDSLREIPVSVVYDGSFSMERLVVEQLIKGPEVITGLKQGTVQNAIPPGSAVNKVTLRDGVCYVDLNEAFMNKIPEISDQITIYSVVDSLTSLDTVVGVQFLIDGQTRDSYFGIKGFDGIFERNEELIVK